MSAKPSLARFILADSRWLAFYFLVSVFTLGLFFSWTVVLLGALVGFVIHNWWDAFKLHNWIKDHSDDYPPDLHGVLAEIGDESYRVFKREKRLTKLLKNSFRRTRESISALSEAVIMIDGTNHIVWWNPAAEHLLGLEQGDQGLHLLSLLRMPALVEAVQSEHNLEKMIIESWLKPGVYLQFSLTRFGDNEGIMLVEDVTKFRKLEKMRRDFVANVSHELKTPITVFSGYVEMLQDQEALSPLMIKALGQMQHQSSRMESIVNDLLMLSQLESEKPPELKDVDMPKLIEKLVQTAQALSAEKQHSFEVDLDSALRVKGIEKELESAVGNLIVNAVKYTPSGGRIQVRWFEQAGKAVLEVEDNGIGIEAKHLSRLTERFYRVDSGRSRDTGGTGLGLAIVKHVAARHDTKLHVKSKLGAGSVFRLVFTKNNALSQSDAI